MTKREQATAAAEKMWQIIEDSSAYSFNASHSLCVSYDSLYGAYLKTHHTYEYYEVILSMYSGVYDKSKKDLKKVGKIKEEMEAFYGIKIGGMRYGQNNTEFLYDKEQGIMQQSLLGVKYLNSAIVDFLSQCEVQDTFIEALDYIGKNVNKRAMESLIKINYFERYAKRRKLLVFYALKGVFSNTQIRKSSLEKKYEGLSDEVKAYVDKKDIENIVKKYAQNETELSFTKIDKDGLLRGLFDMIPNLEMTDEEIVDIEISLMDTVNTIVNIPYGEVMLSKRYQKKFLFRSYKTGKVGWMTTKTSGEVPDKGAIVRIGKIQGFEGNFIARDIVVI